MVRFAAAALALLTSVLGLSASGNQILLLDFSTPSCGPCRQMEPLIRAFEQAGYPIRKVDASREPNIAQQFGVNRFPTFIMLVDGREISRNVGMVDTNQLQQMFKDARDKLISDRRQQSQIATPVGDARLPEETAATVDASHAALFQSTVRLRVDDGKFRSFGTGTIIDARDGEALVITCGHLFRDSKGKTPVNVEMFEATDGRVRVAGQVSGWVLNYDLERDVALVVMRPGRTVTPASIAARGSHIERGDRVVNIGCSNGNDPTAVPTRITALDRYQGAPNIEAGGAPVEGRSGGGLFNDRGELIGVCYAADYEGNEGLYAALESIHDEIARLNLHSVDEGLARNDSTTPIAAHQSPDSLVPVVRGQNDPAAATTTTVGPTSIPGNPPEGLNQTEQAAWEEIVKRAAESEVIVIVRPKDPGGQSEVITLDNVSPQFVEAIAGRQRNAQPAIAR
jgi:thiol-disulfide isomerase/thioredoxin